MTILKCKMCGGDLEVNIEMTIGTCQYCESTMTIPKATDDKKANLYNRANHYRRNNDFDKAKMVYESILNEDSTDAEAYWGLLLCKYGIEYVEEPSTHERIPTCHRTQYASIISDSDYLATIDNADYNAKEVYRQEAENIDRIQKKILEISSKEEPYDVFICYKETDDLGQRTRDSVLAQQIYDELTKREFKVFFSRKTLEKKLGSTYEPIIFAALNSSKVMVVVGTKPEYFNSVWVKNEWNRYREMIKNGADKVIIPAYRDMDAYDMPEELIDLQALNMSNIGFLQDLCDGLSKIVNSSKKNKSMAEELNTVVTSNTISIQAIIKRAFLFLEDKEFNKAAEYFNQVLDQDPENACAYWGMLLATTSCTDNEQLKRKGQILDNDKNYQKAVRFSKGAKKETYTNISQFIKNLGITQIEKEIEDEHERFFQKKSEYPQIIKNKAIEIREIEIEDLNNEKAFIEQMLKDSFINTELLKQKFEIDENIREIQAELLKINNISVANNFIDEYCMMFPDDSDNYEDIKNIIIEQKNAEENHNNFLIQKKSLIEKIKSEITEHR